MQNFNYIQHDAAYFDEMGRILGVVDSDGNLICGRGNKDDLVLNAYRFRELTQEEAQAIIKHGVREWNRTVNNSVMESL